MAPTAYGDSGDLVESGKEILPQHPSQRNSQQHRSRRQMSTPFVLDPPSEIRSRKRVTSKRIYYYVCLSFFVSLCFFCSVRSRFYTIVVPSRKSVIETNSSSLNPEEPRRRPTLVVHIGPSKTGSSTIQRDSCEFSDSLKMDNYIYAGMFSGRDMKRIEVRLLANDNCLYIVRDYLSTDDSGRRAMDIPCWQERMKGVVEGNVSKNVILSNEGYSYSSDILFNKTYHSALQIAYRDWDFLIVATYRRYAEWVVSVVKQYNANGCLTKGGWPHEGGKQQCVKMWARIKRFPQTGKFRYNAWMYSNIEVAIPAWTEGGGRFATLNFHDKPHITSSFYCDILNNTPHTCLQSLNRTVGTHSNPRSVLSVACSNIVYRAAETGLISNRTTHRTVQITASTTLEQHVRAHVRTYSDLPLNCPDRTSLEGLLRKSLRFEERMMPRFFRSSGVEERHRREFWYRADVEKELCDVDVDRLLAGVTTWDQVLTRLKSATNGSLPLV